MSRWRFGLGVAGVSAILYACSLTTSLTGLSSGGDGDAGSGEASASPDSGADGSSEASADAGVDACAVSGMTTRLCDGFERAAADVRGPWTGENTGGGGTIETLTDGTRGSRVFHGRAPRVQNGLAQAYLVHETRMGSKAHVEAWMRYTTGAFDNGRQLLILDISGAGKTYVAMIVLTEQGLAFYEQVDPGLPSVKTKIHLLKVPFPAGEWHRLSIDLDLDPNTVVLLVDGARALPANEVYDYVSEYTGDELRVVMGPSYSSSPSAEIDAYFDDVVIASN